MTDKITAFSANGKKHEFVHDHDDIYNRYDYNEDGTLQKRYEWKVNLKLAFACKAYIPEDQYIPRDQEA